MGEKKNLSPTELRFGRDTKEKIKPIVPAAFYGILRFLFRNVKIKQIGEIAMEFFFRFTDLIVADWQTAALYLLLCPIIGIVLTGSVKISLVQRLTNKNARKVILFLLGMFTTAIVGAGYIFWTGKIGFDAYPASLPFLAVSEIVLYSLYENTMLRDLFVSVARIVLGKFFPIVAEALASGEKKTDTEQKIAEAGKTAKAEIVKTVKAASNDFENL